MPGAENFTFNAGLYEVADPAEAMRLILTPEGNATTEQRWQRETPYLVDLIAQTMTIDANSVLLDYGCGVGRMAQALIQRFGCRVIGVDSSHAMRAFAAGYVRSDLFFACAPAMLDDLVARGLRCDGALTVWVLQHCAQPAVDIARIKNALKPGSHFFVVNNRTRAVPVLERPYVNDGIDIKALLGAEFLPQRDGILAPEAVEDIVSRNSFWASFQRTN
jgi:SAM-dependent methyltransferase